ncbi:MAG: Xaa-Pro dipeptidase [Xanthomonadales bacterium]|nr:Xaa-Pro dipeptidase [Xanthomonadales bacterium]
MRFPPRSPVVSERLAELYPNHVATMIARAERALAFGGFDHLLLASGREQYRFLDDRPVAFHSHPPFKALVPLTTQTDSWIVLTPGRKPVLVYCQPDDYWHLPPAAPHGYWIEQFDIRVIRRPEEATQHFPPMGERVAIIGEVHDALGAYLPNNPAKVISSLHFTRSAKTEYELACMRMAQRRAVRGHRAAEVAFRGRGSEIDIHRAYLEATSHNDLDLPYGNIVALNEHCAVLHYQYQRHDKPAEHRSFLIDAGAQVHGYASDITRTYGNGDADFSWLLAGVEGAQQQLCAKVRAGQNYPLLHIEAHHLLAGVLAEQDIVRMSAEAMVAAGVSSVFFPHGLGHPIGLQVHDVAGFHANEAGDTIPRPPGHPYLRMTRTLEEDFVVTIEPGLYFIPMLLEQLRAGPHATHVNWSKVEHLTKFGGIRIEHEVRATRGEPENLTRDAFAAG